MALDLTNTTYTYVVNSDGTVTYTAGCDQVAQTMTVPDLSSTAVIEEYLNNYTKAYIAGLQQTQAPTPGQGVPVGQTQSVSGS